MTKTPEDITDESMKQTQDILRKAGVYDYDDVNPGEFEKRLKEIVDGMEEKK